MKTARIHSIETSGFFDGPGIRTVIFFQGCPLRCIYCHNPDTWAFDGGKRYTVSELLDAVKKYKNYYRISDGGVTLSGGEPLMQAEFVLDFIRACKAEGIHVTLDASGFLPPDKNLQTVREVFFAADLILLDIKAATAGSYKQITGMDRFDLLKMIELINEYNKNVWVRYVAIPGINDTDADLERVRSLLLTIHNLKKTEVLPFHQLGQFKYESLGINYVLKNHPEMSQKAAKAIEKKLRV